jgi:hypothetical protein
MSGYTREHGLFKAVSAALVAGIVAFTSLSASAEVGQEQLDAVAADLQTRVDAVSSPAPSSWSRRTARC